jgi:hypothetical protein
MNKTDTLIHKMSCRIAASYTEAIEFAKENDVKVPMVK